MAKEYYFAMCPFTMKSLRESNLTDDSIKTIDTRYNSTRPNRDPSRIIDIEFKTRDEKYEESMRLIQAISEKLNTDSFPAIRTVAVSDAQVTSVSTVPSRQHRRLTKKF